MDVFRGELATVITLMQLVNYQRSYDIVDFKFNVLQQVKIAHREQVELQIELDDVAEVSTKSIFAIHVVISRILIPV